MQHAQNQYKMLQLRRRWHTTAAEEVAAEEVAHNTQVAHS
jgi:hypothetical protein